MVDGFAASLCGQLTAALFSAPTIASLAFFLQLGCVIGVSARMAYEPRLAGRSGANRLGAPAGSRKAAIPATAGEDFAA